MYKLYNTDFRDVIDEITYEADDPVIVTDPPFNIGYHYDTYRDRMRADEYFKMLASLREYAPLVIVHYPEALHRLSIELGEAPRRVLSWVYNANLQRQHRDIAFYGIDPDLTLVKRPYYDLKDKRCREMMKRTGGARCYDWQYTDIVKNISRQKTGHPCQMPLDVMRWAVGIIPGERTVIDPFMGSGTTGIACAMDGRDFVGIEIDPGYYDIARARIEGAKPSGRYMQAKMI